MRMGPVELRMMRGCPPNRQKTVPASAVPRKLSITPFKGTQKKSNFAKHSGAFAVSGLVSLENLVIVSGVP